MVSLTSNCVFRLVREQVYYFNAQDKESWKFLESLKAMGDLEFSGAFPMEYSANSVVQDNRKGGLKHDYILIMKHKHSHILSNHEFEKIPGWLTSFPDYDSLNIKELQNEAVF